MKEIQLTQGKVALVDDDMYDYLMQWKWFANNIKGYFYAGRNITSSKCKQSRISMHRLIMKPDKGMIIDHLDGDALNNQKNNLRICNHSENMRNRKLGKNNTSGYKGVSYQKRDNNWRSYIKFNNKTINIGTYTNPIDAARAYNEAAIKYHGKFAKLNILD